MSGRASVRDVKVDFDFVLNNEIGQIGKYQIFNLIFIAIPAIVSGFMAGDYVFTAARLPHRCAVPECDGVAPVDFAPAWILNAIPVTRSGDLEDCLRYANNTEEWTLPLTGGVCPAYLFDVNRTISCDSYVYERTNTVVYDFNLECNEWLRALPGTLNSLGGMVALAIAGFVSDYFGRRTSIVFFSFNIALIGFVRAFSVNYPMYVTMQFLQTAIGGGAFSAAYILATEIVGPKFRVLTSAMMSSMFALGQVFLGLIAFAVVDWRPLTLVLFTPVFLLVSYRWILCESHRWLLSKNKQEEARAALKKAARMNGGTLTEDSINFLINAIPSQNSSTVEKDEPRENLFLRVLRSSVLFRRCCTTPVWWVTTTFVYYGLSINSVSLSGNMYFNYVSIAAVEIPGYWTAVFVLDKIGRRKTLFCGYMLCAACCIAFAFIPSNFSVLSMCVYLTGKFSIAVVFTSVYLFTSELYPTQYRHSFLGFSSMVGRVGSVLAPLTPPLMVYWQGIPSVMFGGMAALSVCLVLTQPETLGTRMPNTLEDAERLAKTPNSVRIFQINKNRR